MSSNLPLFDTCAHPTLDGRWLDRNEYSCSFSELSEQLSQNGFVGSCAVGLAGLNGYSHQGFAEACDAYPNLVPIAGVNPKLESPETV